MTSIRISGPGTRQAVTAVDDDGVLTITLPDPVVAAPQPPDVPGARQMHTPLRIGFHPTPAEYTTWLSKLPTPWFTRVFNPPGKGLPVWGGKALTPLPASTIPHVSFKDRVPPTAIRAFLDSIPLHVGQVWLTWQHEGDIDWADDVAGYINYWRLLAQTVGDHPARPKVTLVNVHTQYASRYKRRAMDWRAFMLPGVADVDAWDCYRPAVPDVYEAPETLLGLPFTARREFGVRTHITEYGSHPTTWDGDGSGQAMWYRESCQVMQAAGVEAVGFWCNVDGTYEYRPTKQAVLDEWRRLIVQYNAIPVP